jgi:predicted TPR repeat methyltransferase
MSGLYHPFAARLPQHGRVLDAGCGSGRDALAFQKMGFEVEAFDASAAIVEIARAKTGLDIKVDSFTSFQSQNLFDGIWACASLLHLPDVELIPTLLCLRAKLVVGGVLYMSFKRGEGISMRRERKFFDKTEADLSALIGQVPSFQILQVWRTEDLRPKRKPEPWVNALVKAQLSK